MPLHCPWHESCLQPYGHLAGICLIMVMGRFWSLVTSWLFFLQRRIKGNAFVAHCSLQCVATEPLALIGKLLQLSARGCCWPHAMLPSLRKRAGQDRRVSKLKGSLDYTVVEARP